MNFYPETRVLGLSVAEDFVILACVVFIQCQRVTVVTDRDGQTDIPTMASTGLAYLAMLTHCKNYRNVHWISNHCKSAIRWHPWRVCLKEMHPRFAIGNCRYCGKGKRSDVDSWKTVHPSAKHRGRINLWDVHQGMEQSRRRETFPVTRRLGTNRVS